MKILKLVGFASFVGLLLRIYHISQVDLISGFSAKSIASLSISVRKKQLKRRQ
jgi:hypothetical protein